MNENDEFVKKLKEKYEKGEISKETYEDILQRYFEGKKEEESQTREVEMGNKDERRDYKCGGSCTLPPGKYKNVSAGGSLRITGDIEAERVSVAGAIKGEGNIKAESFKCAGSTSIEGLIDCENISIAGAFSGKSIKGESIRIGGKAEFEDMEGENISIGGAVEGKSIRGEKIRIKLDGRSNVDEIRAEDIEIRSSVGFFRKCRGKLKAKNITGENIELECTTADMVDGEKVIVGDDCVVGLLKAEKMKISKNAEVKEVVRR